MVDRLLFGHTEIGSEHLVGHIGGIVLEGVDLRDVAFDEDLEIAPVHEGHAVLDDPGEELLILLVATQLGTTVVRTRDHHVVEPDAVLQHEHVGMQAELPA